ncbi:AMIN domain-containing protein [Nostoc sp. 106C]|uniref:AMIN domain-containing protein n=1 Tax=Nostoc sp. 106C TaxID=1932667 RepID=UPI000A3A2338|nr:AMIN domain-containing protein [Nostoc sp. 106C]OUL17458.1 AMIN domain-containing protein [Nostoc sp. 106C]
MDQRLRTQQFLKFCKQLFGISLFSGYITITLEAGSSIAKPVAKPPQASNYPNVPLVSNPLARLDNWRFSVETLQLEFALSAGTTPHHFYLAQPPRIVVDLPNTKLGYVATQQTYSGAIQRVRVSQLNAGVTRIVLDLAPGNFLDPNQVKLQPVSKKNPTRWVLRPFSSGYRNSAKPGNYPQLPSNVPLNPYNYPQQPSSLPQFPYNYPQQPISQPLTTNQQLPFFTLPPPSNNLPAIPTNQQQPFVVVPPLTPNSQSQLPSSTLPPAIFPNQPGNLNNPAAIAKPDFPIPTVPQYPSNVPETSVIEFGQPIPKTKN